MCPAVRVSLPRTTGRTAEARGRPVRAGEGRLGGGRGSASTVLRATTKRSRRRAALRWGTGPDSTGSSRSEWLPHAEERSTLRFCRRSNRPDDELLPRP